jgi:ATP-dependent Lhr-like helicase
MADAFSLLSEPIRRVLWQMRWTALRPLQEQAIHSLLEGNRDLILSARTAAGKTEAAFLPILSRIAESPAASVQAMYVGPLKALINDQFRRLEELCQHAEIPVHRWHGDVSADKKKKLVQQPSGVLLITPESLESLFINRSAALPQLFHSLSFVVLDELHALLGTERGTHLRSLLFRLQRNIVGHCRYVALSATLGDLDRTKEWLRPDDPNCVEVLTDDDASKAIKYRLHAYVIHPPSVSSSADDSAAESSDEEVSDSMTQEILTAFSEHKNLVFVNSKWQLELLADSLNSECRRLGRPEVFLVHHGSLSREIRETTEKLMQGDRPYTTLCSPTLELGIDIGNVHMVGQVGCPWSSNSLIQRLGRSGRRDGEPHMLRMFLTIVRPRDDAPLSERLYPQLLQAIALTELALVDRWVESPDISPLDLSTFTHQVLSVLAESGGIPAVDLFRQLVAEGVFRRVDSSLFTSVLRSLAGRNLVEQMPSGELILGLAGEQIVRHYDFYSAFATSPEYRVVHQNRLIGTLSTMTLPRVGDHLILAARRWRVMEVCHEREEIAVEPARGRKAPGFRGSGGHIHQRVRQKMHDVLFGNQDYAYLNAEASRLLFEARATAAASRLEQGDLLSTGNECCLWFPWIGTKTANTLLLMAQLGSIDARTSDNGLSLEFQTSRADLLSYFSQIIASPPDSSELAKLIEFKGRRKYDQFLQPDQLDLCLADHELDLVSALQCLSELCATRNNH